MTAMRRRCLCGEMFSQQSVREVHCQACRRPKRQRPRDRSVDALFRHWTEAEEERWRLWLIAQLEPFLGQETVKVSDLIERLHGQPVATPAKKGRAA